jgi:hypothetical protein
MSGKNKNIPDEIVIEDVKTEIVEPYLCKNGGGSRFIHTVRVFHREAFDSIAKIKEDRDIQWQEGQWECASCGFKVSYEDVDDVLLVQLCDAVSSFEAHYNLNAEDMLTEREKDDYKENE